jgi:hypothetical protein
VDSEVIGLSQESSLYSGELGGLIRMLVE